MCRTSWKFLEKSKNFQKKTLDKTAILYYNKDTNKEREETKMAQRNEYILKHKDGSTSRVVANSYREVKSAVRVMGSDAYLVQRVYKDGSRGTVQVI